MKANCLANHIYSSHNLPRRDFGMSSIALKQHLYYRKKRRNFTGKEQDAETGLYYYGARYLAPKTSRWLSGDPAMGEYFPVAPVNDEAKKRNGNLPGQGGVFNYVNLHAYHYAGNNPVKYVDPTGEVATYSIDDENKTVTINLDIVIYGKDANASLAQEYKDRIMEQWGQDSNGDPWQMDIRGKSYTLIFNVNITVGEGPDMKTRPGQGTTNFIEVDNSTPEAYVEKGYLGKWTGGGTPQRNGLSLTIDNFPAHETGHLLGFQDRYSKKDGIYVKDPEWTKNIMATTNGRVEQRNIDALGSFISGRETKGVLRSWWMDRF